MGPFVGQTATMQAVQSTGSAMAADPAILGSPADVNAFTFVPTGNTVLAFTMDEDTLSPYSLTPSAPRIAREPQAMRSADPHPWNGIILTLTTTTSRIVMDFLYDRDAQRIDLTSTPIADFASAIRTVTGRH